MLLSEMDRGLQTKSKVFVQAQFAQHADNKAWLIVVHVRVPLLAGLRIHIAVVFQLQVHHIDSHEEAIVQESRIQIRAVLDTLFLGNG